MKNPATINLTSLQKGDVVYITVCSQCASEATIELTGLKDKIVFKKGNSQADLQILSSKTQFSNYEGGDVKLNIQIDNKETEIKIIKSVSIMSDEEGNEKGINYTFYIDDQKFGDNDYNDYCINISTFHKQG
ncbi:MAG: hypothetical protein IKZ46_07085 [Victivallales bacterium]|nr:hypothetical protein [Victivallales bacterium]